MSAWGEVKLLLARKLFHVLFVALMAVPFIYDVPSQYYIASLVVVSGVVYSIQVRRPAVWRELRQNFFKTFEEIFERLEQLLPLDKPELRTQYFKTLRQIEELIDAAERDYEKRHGYLGVLMGAVGFLAAYVMFGKGPLLASIISMAVYDAVSAIGGTLVKSRRAGKISVSGTALGTVTNIAALVAAGFSPHSALLITAFVVLADALSPEDNLTIPIAAAAGAYLLP
ncbi:MAG: phosphatidate cytidylyltransferase [Pyrobaculum sp.]